MITRYFYNGFMYELSFHLEYFIIKKFDMNNNFIVSAGVPVIDNNNYRVKINKKTVSAAGGSAGLWAFCSNCIKENFMLCFTNNIIDKFC